MIEKKPCRWVNHRYNFDNLGQALMSLFVLSSKDGWVSIMYQGIDAVGVDIQVCNVFLSILVKCGQICVFDFRVFRFCQYRAQSEEIFFS